MIYVLGHPAEVTTEKQCQRSATDHIELKHAARKDRQERHFDVDSSFVLCMRCGKALSLRID
jgi:hypothetical protein